MLSSSPSLDNGWTPAALRPAAWFEAGKSRKFQSSAGTTASVSDSDVIGFIGDLSGNFFDMTSAADDTTRPTLQGTATYPYISFDGSNDILRRTSAVNSYAAGSCSIFVALRSNAHLTSTFVFGEGDSASNNSVYGIIAASSAAASTGTALIRNSANTALHANSTAVQTNAFDSSDRVYGIVDDGAGLTPYLDGVSGTASAYTRSGTLTQDRTGFGGLQRAAASSWWAGRVYGLVVINRAISSIEALKLTNYMGKLQGRYL